VFLAYFNKELGRFPDLQTILDDVRASQGHYKIVTSVLTKVEVAYIAAEKTAPDDYPNVETILDEFWGNTHIVELIEVSDDVSHRRVGLSVLPFSMVGVACAQTMLSI